LAVVIIANLKRHHEFVIIDTALQKNTMSYNMYVLNIFVGTKTYILGYTWDVSNQVLCSIERIIITSTCSWLCEVHEYSNDNDVINIIIVPYFSLCPVSWSNEICRLPLNNHCFLKYYQPVQKLIIIWG